MRCPISIFGEVNPLDIYLPLHNSEPSLNPPPAAVRLDSPLPVPGARVRIEYLHNQKASHKCDLLFWWRRKRDSNPRAGFPTYALSRGASSTCLSISPNAVKLNSRNDPCILLKWRRGWDSNPRALSDKRFSRPPRYDHFDTSPIKSDFDSITN